MNQKHFVPGLSLFIAGALLVSYPEAIRKPELKRNQMMEKSAAEVSMEAVRQNPAPINIIVCLESISITRGSWLAGSCTSRNPDILTIRLSLCNEEKRDFANVVAQILAGNIRFCGDLGSQCVGISERVYFEAVNSRKCAQAKTPCLFTDAGGGHAVAYQTEFKDKINNLPARGKLCLSFNLELFLDSNIEKCQLKAAARADIFQKIGASVIIPPIPPCGIQ